MKKLIIFSIFINFLYAAELNNTKGYSAADIEVKSNLSFNSKTNKKLTYVEEIEIQSVEFDKNNDYWYKTKYGYVYGASVSTDVRYSKADFLHIRIKPSLEGTAISYYLNGDRVIVLYDAGYATGHNWVYTSEGYASSDYLTPKLNKVISSKNIIFYKEKRKSSPIKNKTSSVNKVLLSKNVRFVVPKATLIPKGETIDSLRKEYNLKPKIKIPKEMKEKTVHKKIIFEKVKKQKNKNEFLFKNTYLYSSSLSYLHSLLYDDIDTNLNTELTNNDTGFSIKFNFKNKGMKNKKIVLAIESLNNNYKKKNNLFFGINHSFKVYKQNFSAGLSLGVSQLTWTKDPLIISTITDKKSLSGIIKLDIENKYIINNKIDININFNYNAYSHNTELKNGIDTYTIRDSSSTKLNLEIEYKL